MIDATAPRARWLALLWLALTTLLGMSTWFSGTAVLVPLREAWQLSPTQGAWLTIAVQLGFVAGALLSALTNLLDVVPARHVLVVSALAAAAANAMFGRATGLHDALLWRALTGVCLAGVYPPGLKLMATWFREDRGRALGMVMQLPEGDRYSMKYQQMTSRLAIMMGGRVAEQLTFGEQNVTSGAQSDIDQATKLARAMVTRWGYSKELGTVAYGENQEEVFLGYTMGRQQNVSEATAQKIDAEVRRLVDEGFQTAKRVLTEKAGDLEILAKGLLEYETLSGEEINNLLAGQPPQRSSGDDGFKSSASSGIPTAGRVRPQKGPGEEPGGMAPQPT